MNPLVPAASLIGPIYFGLRGSPVVIVVLWAAVWNFLRGWATRKHMQAELLREDPTSKSARWTPPLALQGFLVPVVTLALFEALHLGVYWLVVALAGNSN